MTISNDSRTRIKKVFEPIALGMGRLGLTPDGLTLIGFGITVVGAILVAEQQWVIGGLIVFAGGVFDMFDGTLARATGQASKLGAFMDSVFDRAGEVIVYVGHRRGPAVGRRRGWDAHRGVGARIGRPRQLHAGEVRRPRVHGQGPAWRPSASCRGKSGWSS